MTNSKRYNFLIISIPFLIKNELERGLFLDIVDSAANFGATKIFFFLNSTTSLKSRLTSNYHVSYVDFSEKRDALFWK